MGTTRIFLLVPALLHFSCAPKTLARLPQAPVSRQTSSGALTPVPRATEANPPSAPSGANPQDIVNLQLNSVASTSLLHAFRLRERSQVWMVAPGCRAAGIAPILRQGETEVAKVGEANTVELPSGVYQLSFSLPNAEAAKSAGGCTAFFQVHYLTDLSCTTDAARFGILPFDLETPSVESIGDLNADGRVDYKVTFGASPSQVATHVAISQEPPECVRTVFNGIGHVVALNESKKGWRRLYLLDSQYLGSAAPERVVRTYGSTWSVTWSLDYEPSSQTYRKSSVPVRCERTDGVQRALGDPGANSRATLIPQAECQPQYW